MKGADIVVKSLEELGVRYVFGYTGAAILPAIVISAHDAA